MYDMDVKRAYRFRFYPTLEQEQVLSRTFGCARFAYSLAASSRVVGSASASLNSHRPLKTAPLTYLRR
ncbi:helix-turn-helix domain-containing protein [Metallibacterium sp.]